MRGEHSQLFLSDARPFSPVLLDSISRVLISLSSSRTALAQLLHLVPDVMQSRWRIS